MRWSNAIERRRAANRAREKRGLPPRLPMTAYRNELPISSREPDAQVAKMLYRHDPDLELLWAPRHSEWTLWRQLPSGKLALVMEFRRAPGQWLIRHLQKIDITRNGTHTIAEGLRRMWRQEDVLLAESEAKAEQDYNEVMDDADKELETYALRGRHSVLVHPASAMGRPRNRRPGKRIVIGLHTGKVFNESRNDADQCAVQLG